MNERVADFHRLESRLRLTGTLTTRTALRVGAGRADVGGVDLPVMKNAAGLPFIPGASLKGALRSTLEALVRGAERAADRRPGGVWACDPLIEEATAGAAKGCGNHKRAERSAVNTEDHCAVCRLFGSHVVASHARFCDALMNPAASGRNPVEIRDGVSIDRDLRRASDGRKYDFEVVAPGVALGLEIFVENPQPWLMGLLVMGFDQVNEGFTALGGFTSRGLGRVSFAWSSIAHVTAAALLRGESMTVTTGDAVGSQLQAWRDALATKYQEGT
jgi:CRISPR-associated protein Csm3